MNFMKREAREAGFEEGRAEGLQKGKEEEKINIALELLKRNMPIQDVTQITGVSEEKINTIDRKK